MALDFSAAQGSRRGHRRWAVGVGCERLAGIALCAVHRGSAIPRTKTTKRTKTTREMAACGLWPLIFQQHRPPGGAMGGGRHGALLPPGGAMCRYISLRHGTLIFCAMSFASFMSLSVLFSALSIGFAHCVLPTNPIFFQNGYDTYFPENRHFSKNFLQVLEVAGKAIRYTVLKDKSPYWQ